MSAFEVSFMPDSRARAGPPRAPRGEADSPGTVRIDIERIRGILPQLVDSLSDAVVVVARAALSSRRCRSPTPTTAMITASETWGSHPQP